MTGYLLNCVRFYVPYDNCGQYANRIVYDGNVDSTKEFIEISQDKLTFI